MEERYWRHFDLPLMVATLLLVALGLAMIYSASLPTLSPEDSFLSTPMGRQLLYAGLGLGALVLAATVDYRLFGTITPFLYILMIALLGMVLILGQITHGSRRWIDLFLFNVQPSEIAKMVMILVLAKYLSDHQTEIENPRVVATSLAITLIPLGLVYLQPDMGTMLILAAIWLGMILMAGVRLRHLIAIATAGLLLAPFAYLFLLKEYMRQRLATFIDPMKDPLGMGYNVLQSEISVGSGGLWGKGFTEGTQSQLHYLRIQKTDFIFSVLGEELGFVGALVLLGLFILLLFRGVRAASLAQDSFGRLVATGIVTMIIFQVFINIGVNIRLLPVTGIPLPFISYGGSSLITLLFAMGLLQSILMRHRKIDF